MSWLTSSICTEPVCSSCGYVLNPKYEGVLFCAGSQVQLITAWFPASIDKLAPESNATLGELPSLVEAGTGKDPLMRLFEDGSSASGAILLHQQPPCWHHLVVCIGQSIWMLCC